MTPASPATLQDAQIEIVRIDKLLDVNRAMLMDPSNEDVLKVKARINELLDERLIWMAQRDAAKPKRRAKRGVNIPKDIDL